MNSVLKNKNILICVTGSIAAYKACEVIRMLRKEDVNVQVMMTHSAQKFVGKASFAALTNNEVITDIFPETPKAGLEHIEMAMDLDAIVIVPATANMICKAANGVADDIISTNLSICEQPTLFVPAMNFRMWQNPATMNAVEKLRERGRFVMDPETGKLASLHEGEGRLPEIDKIMNAIRGLFQKELPLVGKKVLVSAGPTREAIDPVRFISNRSSGKMGYALAEVARDLGANVTLVSGPVALPPIPEVKMVMVETAIEMLSALEDSLDEKDADYLIMAAAVADYQPAKPSDQKLKRKKDSPILELIPAPDILKTINSQTEASVIAFALETQNGTAEAKRKMADKGAEFIVLNYANESGAGFESNTNRVQIFSKSGEEKELKKDRKDRIAKRIFDFILLHKNR
ncbi:MAG: bifunctional phosphopantothenoylcysteine decarboxylase/phosphopantothenate--cysteine ligase CoaBC [Candidatus Marinimicrobia bacterium]|nr:bifunctional phosphopantothenoylcysteine decarboxylase/phosphopantothenate--cysteine ligase CoaBC [Candidatus Neomarinimicrobiota bacterium]